MYQLGQLAAHFTPDGHSLYVVDFGVIMKHYWPLWYNTYTGICILKKGRGLIKMIHFTDGVKKSLLEDMAHTQKRFVRLSYRDTWAGGEVRLSLDGFSKIEHDLLRVIDDIPFVFRRWEEPYINNLFITKWRTRDDVFYEVRWWKTSIPINIHWTEKFDL